MQLAAIWVKDHHLLKTQTINLGGKYYYKFSEKAGNIIEVEREENSQYIHKFYSSKDSNLSLVSAIVGRNGAGKSTLIEIIREALYRGTGVIGSKFTVLIFENNENEDVSIFQYNPYSMIAYDFEDPEDEKINFSVKHFGFKTTANSRVESIFYSPFLDVKDLILRYDESPDIDISLDKLFQKDYQNNSYKEGTGPLSEHQYQNIYRRFDFLGSIEAKNLQKDFDFPFYDSVFLSFRGVPYHPYTGDKFHNTPYNFRDSIKQIDQNWNNEIYAKSTRIDEKTKIEEDRELVKLWFLKGIISSLFKPLEESNAFLEEGEIIESMNDLSTLSLMDSIYEFLDHHKFTIKNVSLPIKEVKSYIGKAFEIIDSRQKGEIIEMKKMKISFEEAKFLLGLEKKFLEKMIQFKTNPLGFLNLESNIELSSGEKAALDLFSRFHYATSLIKAKDYNGNLPKHFIIFLDEGDLGFHPIWKKKYVKKLVSILPKLFEQFEDSTIQIIFSTHDPLTLSDIPNYNVVYLDKNESDFIIYDSRDDVNRPQYSFGANISHLLSDSFFIDDGLVGEFAVQKIDKTIEWLMNGKKGDEDYHWKLIELIDEPLLKTKLAEMYSEKTGKNLLEEKVLDEQIREMQKRLTNLKGGTI